MHVSMVELMREKRKKTYHQQQQQKTAYPTYNNPTNYKAQRWKTHNRNFNSYCAKNEVGSFRTIEKWCLVRTWLWFFFLSFSLVFFSTKFGCMQNNGIHDLVEQQRKKNAGFCWRNWSNSLTMATIAAATKTTTKTKTNIKIMELMTIPIFTYQTRVCEVPQTCTIHTHVHLFFVSRYSVRKHFGSLSCNMNHRTQK